MAHAPCHAWAVQRLSCGRISSYSGSPVPDCSQRWTISWAQPRPAAGGLASTERTAPSASTATVRVSCPERFRVALEGVVVAVAQVVNVVEFQLWHPLVQHTLHRHLHSLRDSSHDGWRNKPRARLPARRRVRFQKIAHNGGKPAHTGSMPGCRSGLPAPDQAQQVVRLDPSPERSLTPHHTQRFQWDAMTPEAGTGPSSVSDER